MINKPILRATIVAMEPGQVVRVPEAMFTANSVRNTCSNLGYQLLRKYSVHLDRAARVTEVTRIQ